MSKTKICHVCKIEKELKDFYVSKGIVRYDCKSCHRRLAVESQKKSGYFRSERGRDAWNRAGKKAQKVHKNKWSARQKVRYFVKIGKLKKSPCWCGDKKVHGHHEWGYEGENALRVMWLCAKHHHEKHFTNYPV